LKVNATPSIPVYGPPAFATGGGGVIVALLVAVLLRLLVLVAVRVAV
jgi:hypothetical protein